MIMSTKPKGPRRLRWLGKFVCFVHDITINIFGCHCPRRGVQLGFKFGLPTQKERKPMPVEVSITNEQKVKASLSPTTATGKPAQLDPNNPPQWSVISGDSTVSASSDGLSADLISSDTPGDTVYLVKADADLGDGVEEISDTIRLSVVGARAQNLGLTLGTPEAK